MAIRHSTARKMLYDWHGGQFSAFYAAASSGLVEAWQPLYREAATMHDKRARIKIMQWLDAQAKKVRAIAHRDSRTGFYYMLPWANK